MLSMVYDKVCEENACKNGAYVYCKCAKVQHDNKHPSLSISLTPVKKPLNYNRGHF